MKYVLYHLPADLRTFTTFPYTSGEKEKKIKSPSEEFMLGDHFVLQIKRGKQRDMNCCFKRKAL